MNFLKKNLILNNGFTLLETIFAVIVLMIGILSVIALLVFNISQANNFKNRIIAYNLAQEGIEIVKNIRDTNWLSGAPVVWNSGLSDGDHQADYNDLTLSSYDPSGKLKFNGINYQYDGGDETVFQRRINILNSAADKLKVESEVIFKGQAIKLESWLYNWK